MEKKLMPVTIITGFLGAGKTTLLNELLRKNSETEFLIIENEAGEINIDGELLDNANKNKVYELSSGCICCSLNQDLGLLLNSIILSNIKYDYVLIEATGMADPTKIIDMFCGPRVQRYFKLDSVVCLVDAVNFLDRLDHYTEVRKQVGQPHMVLINKTDLADSDTLSKIEEQVLAINPLTEIQKTNHAQITTIKVLNREAFEPASIEKTVGNFNALTLFRPQTNHSHQIQTLSFSIAGDFNMEKFSKWLENFLYNNANSILRIKGILSIENMLHKIALQSVGDNFHVSQGNLWQKGENRESRLVFIGSNLDEGELQNDLNSFLSTANNIEV